MPTPIDILAQKGFPPGILHSLRKDGITHLLDPQVEAVIGFDLLGPEDLLIALPTSCGKTLIGELAGVGTALQGKRAIFSVPLKAIAREKFETFQRRYAEYGLRVRLATGEFTEHLNDLSQGSFDIAVVIHEKLKHLILQNPSFLSGVGVVVLDELQGVAEANRGPNLEFLLGLLKNHRPRVRRVGLAGKLSSTDPLVEDFENRVLSTHSRPIDLHEGIVLSNDTLAETALAEYGLGLPIGEGKICIYRSHNSHEVDSTRLPTAEVGIDDEGTFMNLAAGLAESGETVLVFLSTRRETEQAAFFLAESLAFGNTPPEEDEIESLRDRKLAAVARKGVAYHHADCSARARSLVEEWFRQGKIRVLFCTSTLAQGVNLPAHNVLIHPYVWNRQSLQGELTHLEEATVRNMSGRAGRLGLEEGQGRALLVAHTEREWDLYRSLYWTDLVPATQPSLLLGNMESHLLAGISSGFNTEKDLTRLMSSLLSHRFIDGTATLRNSIQESLEEAEALRFGHCIAGRNLEEKTWSLSPLGKAIALRGLSFETGRFLNDWVDRLAGELPQPLTLLYAVCSCVESQSWTWPRENNPQVRAAWCEEIKGRIGEETLETLGDPDRLDTSLSRRLEDAAKMSMALERWSEGEDIEQIQSEVAGASEGILQTLGEGARWLLESLADIWRIKGLPSESADRIHQLACSVGTGLPDWASSWDLIPSDLLDRDSKLKWARVMSSPLYLSNSETLELVRHQIPQPTIDRVIDFVESLTSNNTSETKHPFPFQSEKEKHQPATAFLSLDFIEEGNLFRVAVKEDVIHLGIRSAELLLRLARQRFQGLTEGWVPKSDLGIDPENVSQRISDLRQRLGKPPSGRKTWIESDRKGHYRLTLEAGEIHWKENQTPPELTALLAT